MKFDVLNQAVNHTTTNEHNDWKVKHPSWVFFRGRTFLFLFDRAQNNGNYCEDDANDFINCKGFSIIDDPKHGRCNEGKFHG